jgi:hypothetical protein
LTALGAAEMLVAEVNVELYFPKGSFCETSGRGQSPLKPRKLYDPITFRVFHV